MTGTEASASASTSASVSASGSGTGSGTTSGTSSGTTPPPGGSERTLGEAMRAPGATSPDVVVIDVVDVEEKKPLYMDPKKDLWITTVDG
jgi:FlaG/FlaF family flagellin (archaellin)